MYRTMVTFMFVLNLKELLQWVKRIHDGLYLFANKPNFKVHVKVKITDI